MAVYAFIARYRPTPEVLGVHSRFSMDEESSNTWGGENAEMMKPPQTEGETAYCYVVGIVTDVATSWATSKGSILHHRVCINRAILTLFRYFLTVCSEILGVRK